MDRIKKYITISSSVDREQYNKSYVFMNENEYDYFEERAAILEFDAKLDREEAEQIAYQKIIQDRKIFSQAS